ncbi:hypothetical protein PR003_g34157 [Phytophthora rubi]|uniref:Uncharacterized protein n=1 Tax=Phytophthora rubi TaxID=129364 RepID=A0A6A4ATC6_9STRA|nr:hypothetical protein PR003_g34157 [Phytophthora rubi]
MALYSGRLGSRGLTVMHFRPQFEMEQLERGSSNANPPPTLGLALPCPRRPLTARPTRISWRQLAA